MRLSYIITLIFSFVLAYKSSAQNCDSEEYALLKHIIESEKIIRLSKHASPAALLCAYSPAESISMYEYFISRLLVTAPEAVKNGIDSTAFQSFMEEHKDFKWSEGCTAKTVKLVNPRGLFRNSGASAKSVSKPLFTQDGQFALVHINHRYGKSAGGYRYTSIYKKNDDGSWGFYANGDCKSFYH